MVPCLWNTKHCDQIQESRNMSPFAQHTSKQLKDNIEYEKNTDKGAREAQEQVEDGEKVLDPATTSSELDTVLNNINNELETECLVEAVRLLNSHPIGQLTDDWVPGHMYSIPGLPGTKSLVQPVLAIWFVRRRWIWDADMPGALVADEMGLGKTFTSVAAAMLCKMVTENVVMGLPLSNIWGNTHEEWVILAHNDFHGIVGEEWKWYLLQRLNSVFRRLWEIHTTTPHGHQAFLSAFEPIFGYNAWSGRDLEDCHRWDDTWNQVQTRQLVARKKYESHPRGSDHQYCRAQ